MKTQPKPTDSNRSVAFRYLDIPCDPQQLLDLLNRQHLSTMETPASLRAWNQNLFDSVQRSKETLVTELRRLVDAWLASGRDAQGVEEPKTRRVKTTIPNGNSGVNGLRESTVFDSIQRWLCENPPGVYMTETGETQVSLRYPLKWWLAKPDQADDPILAALETARIEFLLLMASKAKYAIFKCAREGCGTYYVLEKPRERYFRGSFCPQHLKQQGTRAKREERRKALFETAEKALLRWPGLSKSTRAKYKSKRDYVAGKLRDFGVGSKWVTRNLAQIDASREGRIRNAQEC